MLEDSRLKIFLEVARTGSFTLAARSLGLSQSAVSQSVTNLERELSHKLFTRAKGEVGLTGAGLSLKQYAENIVYWYEAAGKLFNPEGILGENRPVRIVADPVVESYLLPGVLARLASTRPAMTVAVSDKLPEGEGEYFWENDRPLAEEVFTASAMRKDGADVIISVSPSPDTMDFEREANLAGVISASVIASPINRSVSGAALTEEDEHPGETEAGSELPVAKPFSTLAGIPVTNRFVVWDRYMPLMSPDLVARTAFKLSSVEAIKKIVAQSSSLVGIVPSVALEQDSQLLRLPVNLPSFTFDVHFRPMPSFAQRSICILLSELFRTSLK